MVLFKSFLILIYITLYLLISKHISTFLSIHTTLETPFQCITIILPFADCEDLPTYVEFYSSDEIRFITDPKVTQSPGYPYPWFPIIKSVLYRGQQSPLISMVTDLKEQ